MLQSMLPKANATCANCGKRYYICRDCEKLYNKGVFVWKKVCCSPECYQEYITKQGDDSAHEQKKAKKSLEKD